MNEELKTNSDTNIENYINEYQNITFIEFDNDEQLDLSDYKVVPDFDTLSKDVNNLEYITSIYRGEDATNYVMKVLISGYIKGCTDALLAKIYQSKVSFDGESLEYELNLLKIIGETLCTQESDEANRIKDLCTCTIFNQLMIFNRDTKKILFLENTDETMERFNKAFRVTEEIFKDIFSTLLEEHEQELIDKCNGKTTERYIS